MKGGCSENLEEELLKQFMEETIMIFMKRQIHSLRSQKKASLLEVIKKSSKEAVGTEIVIHVKARSDEGTTIMKEILFVVPARLKSNGYESPVIGQIAQEAPEGDLLEIWTENFWSYIGLLVLVIGTPYVRSCKGRNRHPVQMVEGDVGVYSWGRYSCRQT